MNIYGNAKEMQLAALEVSPTNNFTGSINNFSKENATIETDLFDLETLDYYARKKCGFEVTQEEQVEKLEQLRWLKNGWQIGCLSVQYNGVEINSPEDVEEWHSKHFQ